MSWRDPTPGDPEAVAALARRYSETAQAISDAVTALHSISDSSTAWQSGAGTAFRNSTRDTAGTIAKAQGRYEQTSAALAAYSRDLTPLQDEAERAYAEGMAAHDDVLRAQRARTAATAVDSPDQAAVDRHTHAAAQADGRLQQARRRLDDVHQRWDDLGKRAAGEIEDISEGDDLNDSAWDNFLDVVQNITSIAGKLSAIFGVIALICSVIPVLAPFAAFFGALAFITGAISLAGNLLLYANGRASLSDVLWDVVGVISFGAGRAFSIAGRAVATGAKGLAKPALIKALRAGGASARQARRTARAQGVTNGGRAAGLASGRAASRTGWVPRPGEWARAFNPRRAFRDVVDGAAPAIPVVARNLPPVAAAIRRSRLAGRVAVAAGVAGNLGDANSLGGDHVPGWVPIVGHQRPSPVEQGR